jgi:thiamine-monophosphate kinase
MALRDLAHSAVDISDGLFGDLKHILEASQVDAQVFLEQLPKSAALKKQERTIQNQFAANGGDDYELCFTAPADKHDQLRKLSKALSLNLTQIGSITAMTSLTPKLQIFDEQQTLLSDTETAALLKSFDHFK